MIKKSNLRGKEVEMAIPITMLLTTINADHRFDFIEFLSSIYICFHFFLPHFKIETNVPATAEAALFLLFSLGRFG